MKKIIIAGAIIAAGAGAYIYTQQDAVSAYNVLEYVPADTPLFAAQLEPFPLKEYIASAPRMVDPSDQQSFDTLYDPAQPAVNFLLSLMKTYQASLTDADLLIKTFGLPDQVRTYFYTLGLSPVLKIEIANEQAIWDLLDKTELESGFSHNKGTLKNINYRAYPLSNASDASNAEVIVAIDQGLLTITLNSAYHEPVLLEQALGLSKIDNSLADTDVLQKIIKKHNFLQASVAFINHVELIKGLTTQDGNQLAKQISTLEGKFGADATLATIRNPQCAAELATITNNWPRTVAGYTQLDISAQQSTIAMTTIVESNNQVMMNALAAIRGYIPKYTANIENNVFAMALGVDVNKLAGTLNTLWGDLQTPTYHCQPLADMQTEIAASGNMIGMLSMGTNMANGVQGLGIAVLDYAVSKLDTDPQLDNLDALFTLSAENPQQLFNSVKMFLPELQHLQLSSDSEPVSLIKILPIPVALNLDPKLAIKGKHIVVYNGEKGKQAANQLATEPLAKNGLNTLSFDFKKMMTPLITATELAGEEIPQEMLFLTEYDARMQMSVDIDAQGLIFKSKINNKAPK